MKIFRTVSLWAGQNKVVSLITILSAVFLSTLPFRTPKSEEAREMISEKVKKIEEVKNIPQNDSYRL